MQQAQPEKGPPTQGASASSSSNKKQSQPTNSSTATSTQLHGPFYSITPPAPQIPLAELPEKLPPETGNASTAASSGDTIRTHPESDGEDSARPNNSGYTIEPATLGVVAATVTLTAFKLYATSATAQHDVITALEAFCERVVKQVSFTSAASNRTQYFSADVQQQELSSSPKQREEETSSPAASKKKESSKPI